MKLDEDKIIGLMESHYNHMYTQDEMGNIRCKVCYKKELWSSCAEKDKHLIRGFWELKEEK